MTTASPPNQRGAPRAARWPLVSSWPWGGAAALLALTWFAYRRSFAVPFQFDDLPIIVDNPDLHMVRLDWSSLWRAAGGFAHGRPVAWLSFGLNHLAGGLQVRGYHAVNLAVHLLNGLLVALLAASLLERLAPELDASARRRASWVAAALFLLHPLQTQAVTYVVQRMASLGACFGLLGTLALLRGLEGSRPRPALLGLAGLSLVLGVGTKENLVFLPVVLAALALLLSQRAAAWARGHRLLLSGAALGAAAAGAALVLPYWSFIESEQRRFGLSVCTRLLTQGRVIFHYLSLLAWPAPSRLRVDYAFPASTSLLSPPFTLLAILGLLGALASAVALRRRAPVWTFAVVWFLGNLVVEQSVLPIDLIFEHRVYLPSFGPFLLAAWGLERAALRARRAPWLVAAPVAVLLALAADRRNAAWADPARLFAEAARDASGPVLARSLLSAGGQRLERGEYAEAERLFRQVIEVEPGFAEAYANLGNVARERGDLTGAEAWYGRATALAPGFAEGWMGLADMALRRGRLEEAEERFRRFAELAPRDARGPLGLGGIAARRGDLPAALSWFARAAELDPGSASARLQRARALLVAGRPGDALAEAELAVRLDPRRAAPLAALGDCLAAAGRKEEARRAWGSALQRDARLPGVHFQLANLLADEGDLAGAERELEREVEIGPHLGAYDNLGALQVERDPSRARAYYEKALEIDPRDGHAKEGLRLLDAAR
ncbi:MAG TPA: tetratricopeptide repeat protein [Anaeromyxobacteraceae bacterium]|jgi:tetratricopeptide (TPR) repeat protein|nr:tetratricopeptide repeat protein [Anaeromyxobacteraceae bacterium]